MKKLLLLLFFIIIYSAVWSQPPPPPPPPPVTGAGAPIDTDVLYFFITTVLFSVYKLNKKKLKTI